MYKNPSEIAAHTKRLRSKVVVLKKHFPLTLFRMDFFGAAHGGGRGAKTSPLLKICHIYPTMMKLGTVIPYPKKIQKIYESRVTHLEFY